MKNVGPYELEMEVGAEYKFEKPHSPVAVIDEYVYGGPEVGFVPRFRRSPGIQ